MITLKRRHLKINFHFLFGGHFEFVKWWTLKTTVSVYQLLNPEPGDLAQFRGKESNGVNITVT